MVHATPKYAVGMVKLMIYLTRIIFHSDYTSSRLLLCYIYIVPARHVALLIFHSDYTSSRLEECMKCCDECSVAGIYCNN